MISNGLVVVSCSGAVIQDQQDDGSCSVEQLAVSSGSSRDCKLIQTVVQKHSELQQMPTILNCELN